ncbi:DUF2919 family protein [Salmonella enterica subsp. enterica]|nr:DUF2919 family protein [Salmonella enterica]ECC9940714.1 DUF2919 family protein [Salmonella enterica subsp. enterica]ECU9999309.1 DUF2919 family protein [Salmonella enterica subsp. diarizonae serovar 48:i:z]
MMWSRCCFRGILRSLRWWCMTFTGKAGENRREVRRRIMMLRHSPRKAGDYDDNGLLKVPGVFWCGVLLQTRAWWLTGRVLPGNSS